MYRMLFLIGPVWLYPNLTIYVCFLQNDTLIMDNLKTKI